jgi:hypothetical protein
VIAQQLAYTLLINALRLHLADSKQRSSGWLFALADVRMTVVLNATAPKASHDKCASRILRSLTASSGIKRFTQRVAFFTETTLSAPVFWRSVA